LVDPDIAAMKLEYLEKSGLQIYRNYTRAFEEHAIKRFVEALNLEPLNLTDFRRPRLSSLVRRCGLFRLLYVRLLMTF
jgi:hypothetical protein